MNTRERRPIITPLEGPYPLCIPDKTYGITQFWAEEYWAWCQIQKLRENYPGTDFRGLVNSTFENYLQKILNTTPHANILNTSSFDDIPENSWEISNKMITLATSHAPSRYKAENFLQEYKDNFRILTFDAHLDLGNYNGIHGAWISDSLAKRVAMVGGWAELEEELTRGTKAIRYLHSTHESLKNDTSFQNWIKGKNVYITIDLDFFRPKAKFLGLCSFWHRNLFIGHSLNLNQQIQLLPNPIDLSVPTLLGKEINILRDLQSFRNLKLKSIEFQIQELIRLIDEISLLLQANNSSLLGLDLVEYSAICDWEQITINALVKNFGRFEKKLKPFQEK